MYYSFFLFFFLPVCATKNVCSNSVYCNSPEGKSVSFVYPQVAVRLSMLFSVYYLEYEEMGLALSVKSSTCQAPMQLQ